MTETLAYVPIHPLRIGSVANEVLGFDSEIEVIAVFERSFYVAAQGGIICVGTQSLGDGPFNVLLDGFDDVLPDWARLGITREAKGRLTQRRLDIGDMFALSLQGIAVWTPAPWPPIHGAKLAATVVALRALARPLCPAEGLGGLVLTGLASANNRAATAAVPLITDIVAGLPTALHRGQADDNLVRAATLLIGLGPGLTPSGDDLLGGMLLTLAALGHVRLRDALWQELERELDLLTVDISGAHLAAAADGLGAAVVHAMLHAILVGDARDLIGPLQALAALGHSSGIDTLAGIILVLDAAVAAR